MRIRKRHQSPLPPPDLSSSLPPWTAAAAVAPPVAAAGGATGGKDGAAMAAAAVAAHVSGGGYGGGGGRGLHPKGRTTNPAACVPFRPPSSAVAAAGGAERGDLPPPRPPLPARDVLFAHGRGEEVPKQEQDGENGWDGSARWNMDALSGGNIATAPKSLGAEASEAPVVHGDAAAVAAAETMVRWSVEEEGFLENKKKRGGYHAQGRSWGLEEEEEKRPSKTRRREAAASRNTTVVATAAGTAPTSAGTVSTNYRSAPSATKECEGVMMKEEGAEVMPAVAAAMVDRNCGGGNGKKRRSPAVLMEGSRCSRVNGRGWRCCQQTLVGYSLCEHHLGKGRLRSMSSVRCNNGRARKKQEVATDGAAPPPPSVLRQQNQLPLSAGDEEDEEEEKPSKRRRHKIGMVKARSISSLLHQPDHPAPTTVAAPAAFPSPSPAPAATSRPVTAAVPPPHGADTMVA